MRDWFDELCIAPPLWHPAGIHIEPPANLTETPMPDTLAAVRAAHDRLREGLGTVAVRLSDLAGQANAALSRGAATAGELSQMARDTAEALAEVKTLEEGGEVSGEPQPVPEPEPEPQPEPVQEERPAA